MLITKLFSYALKYNRKTKLWTVIINGKNYFIKKLSDKLYLSNEFGFKTLRDAIYSVLIKEKIL